MLEFSLQHKAVVLKDNDFQKFVEWATSNEISFQEVSTDSDANELYQWLPSEAEKEYESSWEASGGC